MTPIAQGQCASRQTAPGALFCDRDILDVLAIRAKRDDELRRRTTCGIPMLRHVSSPACITADTAVGDVDDRRPAIFMAIFADIPDIRIF